MFFQKRAEKVFKNSSALLVICWFIGGCSEPLFLSRESEREMPRKAASKDTVFKREKAGSVGEITPRGDSYIRRLKAESLDSVPLEEPFVRKTADLGPAFPQGKRVAFTVPLNGPHSENSALFVQEVKEPSHSVVKGAAFTIQPERSSFKGAGGGAPFIEKLSETPLRAGKTSLIEIIGQPGEGSPGMEPVSFLEAAEQFSLERGNGVFAAEHLDGEFFTERGETFFMDRWKEKINKPALVNSTLQMVFFDQDSFALSEKAQIILDANIEWLKMYPHIDHIVLEGHCDSVGSESYNRILGLKRAESVKEYLQSQGIPAETLDPVSYGKTEPLSDTNTDINRRVEMVPMR